jgi:hypothetical protein
MDHIERVENRRLIAPPPMAQMLDWPPWMGGSVIRHVISRPGW